MFVFFFVVLEKSWGYNEAAIISYLNMLLKLVGNKVSNLQLVNYTLVLLITRFTHRTYNVELCGIEVKLNFAQTLPKIKFAEYQIKILISISDFEFYSKVYRVLYSPTTKFKFPLFSGGLCGSNVELQFLQLPKLCLKHSYNLLVFELETYNYP